MTAPSRSGSGPSSAKGNSSHNALSDLLDTLTGGSTLTGGLTAGSFLDTLKGIVNSSPFYAKSIDHERVCFLLPTIVINVIGSYGINE